MDVKMTGAADCEHSQQEKSIPSRLRTAVLAAKEPLPVHSGGALYLTESRGVSCDAGFLAGPRLALILRALIRVIFGLWMMRVARFPVFAPRISQPDGPSWPLLSGVHRPCGYLPVRPTCRPS